METHIIDKERPCLHVHYRAIHLRPDAAQKMAIERYFGLVRVIGNYLLAKTKNHSEEQARGKIFNVRDLEEDVLQYMQQSELPLFKEGLITPEILRGIVVAWVSEWEDFRHHRTKRPSFKQHQDVQKFYIIDTAVSYTENNFKLTPCPEFQFSLRSSRFPLSNKAPVHLVKRTEDGEYWLFTLHEALKHSPDTYQDEVLASMCAKVIDLENEVKYGKRRYLSTSGSRRSGNVYVECQLLTLRKIILDRLLRVRDQRILNQQVIEQLHRPAA